MAQEKFAVRLTVEDRSELVKLIRSARSSAQVINRARILLKTDEGWSASQVASALDTSPRTVFRTKRRYAEEGLDGVLYDHPQANRYRSLDDRGEAHLIALACSDAPEGPRPPHRSGQPGHGEGDCGGVGIKVDHGRQPLADAVSPRCRHIDVSGRPGRRRADCGWLSTLVMEGSPEAGLPGRFGRLKDAR